MIGVFLEFRKSAAHDIDDNGHKLMNKKITHLQMLTAKEGCATQDAAQHVAATLIVGNRAVSNGEREAAHVIGNHAKCDVGPQLWIGCFGDGISALVLGILTAVRVAAEVWRFAQKNGWNRDRCRNCCQFCPEESGRCARIPSRCRHAAPATDQASRRGCDCTG